MELPVIEGQPIKQQKSRQSQQTVGQHCNSIDPHIQRIPLYAQGQIQQVDPRCTKAGAECKIHQQIRSPPDDAGADKDNTRENNHNKYIAIHALLLLFLVP